MILQKSVGLILIYEFAAIPGTIVCGWLSDKLFKGRRALTTMIYMVLIAVSIFVYWQFSGYSADG